MASKKRMVKGTVWCQPALPFDVFLRVLGVFGGEIPTKLSDLAGKLDGIEVSGKLNELLSLILVPATLPAPLDSWNKRRIEKLGITSKTLTAHLTDEQVGEVLAYFFLRYVKLMAKLGNTRAGSSIFPWRKKGPTLVDAFLMLTSFSTIWQVSGSKMLATSQDSQPPKE